MRCVCFFAFFAYYKTLHYHLKIHLSKNLNYMRTLIIFTTFSFIILSSFGNHTYISTRNKYTSSEQIQKAKIIYH